MRPRKVIDYTRSLPSRVEAWANDQVIAIIDDLSYRLTEKPGRTLPGPTPWASCSPGGG